MKTKVNKELMLDDVHFTITSVEVQVGEPEGDRVPFEVVVHGTLPEANDREVSFDFGCGDAYYEDGFCHLGGSGRWIEDDVTNDLLYEEMQRQVAISPQWKQFISPSSC